MVLLLIFKQQLSIKEQTLHPASKSIVFNKSLNNNDGLLTNEVAVNEGITFKQAQKNIEDYVAYLNDSLISKKFFRRNWNFIVSRQSKYHFCSVNN